MGRRDIDTFSRKILNLKDDLGVRLRAQRNIVTLEMTERTENRHHIGNNSVIHIAEYTIDPGCRYSSTGR